MLALMEESLPNAFGQKNGGFGKSDIDVTRQHGVITVGRDYIERKIGDMGSRKVLADAQCIGGPRGAERSGVRSAGRKRAHNAAGLVLGKHERARRDLEDARDWRRAVLGGVFSGRGRATGADLAERERPENASKADGPATTDDVVVPLLMFCSVKVANIQKVA